MTGSAPILKIDSLGRKAQLLIASVIVAVIGLMVLVTVLDVRDEWQFSLYVQEHDCVVIDEIPSTDVSGGRQASLIIRARSKWRCGDGSTFWR